MSYESVDKLQNLLADRIFNYTTDKKKASGRALGTFIEIITYYLIKSWGLESYTAIERPLPEYGNDEIAHNVEFTLHGNKLILNNSFDKEDIPISINKLVKKHKELSGYLKKKTGNLLDSKFVIRNACTLIDTTDSFYNCYINSNDNTYKIFELLNKPFAMFECKRVGIEEGNKKGPQTIEKAKQGSYVARTVSSLQKIRLNNGSIGGIIQKPNDSYIIDDYYKLLETVINTEDKNLLKNFILTVGIVSNHGNWFSSENPNKELKVLAQSYDWLIFLTDKGISDFITQLLINPTSNYSSIKKAFIESYNANKKGNVFTKVKMNYYADKELITYFTKNKEKIESWFNIISPKKKCLNTLQEEIKILSHKDWWSIYK